LIDGWLMVETDFRLLSRLLPLGRTKFKIVMAEFRVMLNKDVHNADFAQTSQLTTKLTGLGGVSLTKKDFSKFEGWVSVIILTAAS
jgi:hypothetical protein